MPFLWKQVVSLNDSGSQNYCESKRTEISSSSRKVMAGMKCFVHIPVFFAETWRLLSRENLSKPFANRTTELPPHHFGGRGGDKCEPFPIHRQQSLPCSTCFFALLCLPQYTLRGMLNIPTTTTKIGVQR
jgi:hypothetical protein